MFDAFAKALKQMPDPAFRKVLLIGIAAGFAVLVALAALVWWGARTAILAWSEPEWGWDWLNAFIGDAVDWLLGIAAGAGGIAIAWFLFPLVVTSVVGLLLEEVARAVERKHYPEAGAPRDVPVVTSIVNALKFVGFAVLLNILALPLYLLPGANILVYYGLNGVLLGREFYHLVAERRLEDEAAKALKRRHSATIFLFGVAVAFCMTIPVANLAAPLVATATMLHLFEKFRRAAAN